MKILVNTIWLRMNEQKKYQLPSKIIILESSFGWPT